mgnify:CR=1 FL=1
MGRLWGHGEAGGYAETAHPLGEPFDATHGVGLWHGGTDVHHEVECEADEADLRACGCRRACARLQAGREADEGAGRHAGW